MGEKLLLVEDHEGTRGNVSKFLGSLGYDVIEASDGLAALDILDRQSVDLVISDLVLPNLHGLNLVKEIHSRWPRIAVIVISAYLSEESGKIILEREAEFLAKPFNLQALAAKVYGALLRKNIRRWRERSSKRPAIPAPMRNSMRTCLAALQVVPVYVQALTSENMCHVFFSTDADFC
jgi:DNA-binding response OmpR family regulator